MKFNERSSSEREPDLSVIIVNYRTPHLLMKCLSTLKNSVKNPHEIIVVDNGSRDGISEQINLNFSSVKLIENVENLGYARGVNMGIRNSSGEHLLILNADTELADGSVEDMIDLMKEDEQIGIAAPQLIDPGGEIQLSCRTFYTPFIILLRRTFLGTVYSDHPLMRDHLMQNWDHNSLRPVDWVIGAALMTRRSVLEKVGNMDERYFLYMDDVDWCRRMWMHGKKVVYFPDMKMIHHYPRSSRKLLENPYHYLVHFLSFLKFAKKWGGIHPNSIPRR